MDKKKTLLKLAEDLNENNIYDDFLEKTRNLDSDEMRLGIMGQHNTAKTTLINALVGLTLPVSNLPSTQCYSITYGIGKSQSEYSADKWKQMEVDSEWLKKHKMSLIEINNDIVPDGTTAVELCEIVTKFDMCVYLLNAQSALNRTDLFILDNLKDIQMPVILALSRIDLLSDSDKEDVYSYIRSNIAGYDNITLLDIDTNIQQASAVIKDAIDSTINSLNIFDIRKKFENFFLTIAIGKLYEICQSRIEECEQKKGAIEKSATDKLLKLDEKSTLWLSVESNFRQRINSISEKLRTFLMDRKEDMLRRLSHDVDVCGDVKLFWEKDFPFRLEEMMRSEMGAATQLVNQELVKTIQWLQDELLKQFRCKITLTTGIVNDRGKCPIQNSGEVRIADTQKLKIVTRIGTAATVIAAGALFATSGIGGIIMAVSMVSGLGAEFFMRKQNNDSKEHIKNYLPDIIERANLQLVTDYEVKIQEVTSELVSHLQNLKVDWLESSKKMIEQERAIANFNFGPSKWNSIMDRINQLGEIFIN